MYAEGVPGLVALLENTFSGTLQRLSNVFNMAVVAEEIEALLLAEES